MKIEKIIEYIVYESCTRWERFEDELHIRKMLEFCINEDEKVLNTLSDIRYKIEEHDAILIIRGLKNVLNQYHHKAYIDFCKKQQMENFLK